MLLLLLSLGCAKHGQPAAAPDQLHMVASALAAGSALMDAFGPLYQDAQDVVLCAGATALAAGLQTASDAVEGAAEGKEGGDASLPALALDLAACDMPMGDGEPDVSRLLSLVRVATNAASVVAYQVEIECVPRAWLDASLQYADGLIAAVATELAAPDWQLSIPSASVALSACE